MKKLLQILFSTLTIYIFIIFTGAYLTLKVEQEDNNANIKDYITRETYDILKEA